MRAVLDRFRASLQSDLGFRAGEWVEVKSAQEIFATLDDQGCVDALPFMPEMFQYSGKKFRVFKSAHKTCDTIGNYKARRMANAVHLEGLRCDGEAHGGCQAGCLLFWKEAWLRRSRDSESQTDSAEKSSENGDVAVKAGFSPGVEQMTAAVDLRGVATNGEKRYRCQATEMLRATTPLKWWDLGHYTNDLISGNVRLLDFIRYVIIASFNMVMRLHWRGRPYPYVRGLVTGKTPDAVLDLQPGELVEVRSKNEIMRTLNQHNRNRGLSFDVEMTPYCGRTFRVLRRVEKIIDEKSGRMIRLPNNCVILDHVTCSGCFSTNRLFCPRSIYPYWHEIWLKRVR